MAKGLLDYGRYPDGHVGCPRAASDMTPCIARDGAMAVADDSRCVGCNEPPGFLTRELREAMGLTHSADLLRHLVTEATKDLE